MTDSAEVAGSLRAALGGGRGERPGDRVQARPGPRHIVGVPVEVVEAAIGALSQPVVEASPLAELEELLGLREEVVRLRETVATARGQLRDYVDKLFDQRVRRQRQWVTEAAEAIRTRERLVDELERRNDPDKRAERIRNRATAEGRETLEETARAAREMADARAAAEAELVRLLGPG